MNISDLIQLLNNRLREFKLSRDYARMSGDLERMNAADKEIIALEDTLYKLNLLIDASKSSTVKESLTEIITDGSASVLSEYDITPYATDPEHEVKITNILSKMGVMDTVEKIDDYISGKYLSSPVTGEMVMSAALAYSIDTRLMMAIMQLDSQFGTTGVAVMTLNPGNVGNDDAGNIRTYDSWQEGVTAVAEWLNRHRISKIIPNALLETALLPNATSTPEIVPVATSTPEVITPLEFQTSTTTPGIATSTPEIVPVATSTLEVITPLEFQTSTTTPGIATSTPEITPEPSATSTSSGQASPTLETATTTTSN